MTTSTQDQFITIARSELSFSYRHYYIPVFVKEYLNATTADLFFIETTKTDIHVKIISVSLVAGVTASNYYELFICPFRLDYRLTRSDAMPFRFRSYFFRQFHEVLTAHPDFWNHFKCHYGSYFLLDCTYHNSYCTDTILSRVPLVRQNNIICSSCCASVNIYWKRNINFKTLTSMCKRKNQIIWKEWARAIVMYDSYIQFIPEEVVESILLFTTNFHL